MNTRRLLLPLLLTSLPAMLCAEGVDKAIPDYSQTERSRVPEAFKWKVSDLFPSQEAWRMELEALKKDASGIEPLLKGWTESPKAMADLQEKLTELAKRGRRVHAYASLQADMDMADPQFQRMKGEVQTFFVGFQARLASLNSDLLRLGREKVDQYVQAEPRLAPYRVGFDRILRGKDHILPEGEERVMAMTGLFASAPEKVSELLNDVDIPRPEVTLTDGTKTLLNYANYSKYRAAKNPADRRTVMEAFWGNQKKYENAFAALLDAEMKQHVFNAKLRAYPTTLDAALFGNAIDPAVYRNLISTVRANLAPLHRFIRLRQKMLGLPEFHYGDIYASAVQSVDRAYPYQEGRKLVVDAMTPLGQEYGSALNGAFDKGWVDIYPNKNKQTGAYSSGVYGVHPFVKMNYDGTYDAVSTLAHELGHAMHSHFSCQAQPHPTSQYPIFLAEIASTFNENLLMRHLLKAEKDDALKLYLLDSYLDGMRATLYRQTLFAEFELAMNERVEQGQTLTPDWLDQKYLELTRTYYGHDLGVTKVDDYIQCEWSNIPHFFMNYYVFQYSTGIVASTALADAVTREGEPARKRYLGFLSAGGSKFPLETLKDAGLDMSSPKPVEAALKAFDNMVGEMEAIYARQAKTGK